MRLDHGQIEVVDDDMAEVFRTKTPAERLGIGFNIWASVQKMLTSHLKKTHSDWDSEKVQSEVARRMLRGSV